MRRIALIFLCGVLLASCGVGKRRVVRVGVDPGFFPMEVMGREPAVLGFCNELLEEVSREERVDFERVNVAWDALLEGLSDGKYEGVLSSMQPYVFNMQKYAFSRLFLKAGPVLIVKYGSLIHGFKDLQGKEVGVTNMVNEATLVENGKGVIPRESSSIAQALLDVDKGRLDAAFLDRIPAEGFVNDLYEKELKIVTGPLGESGLRFVTLHNIDEQWVDVFDEGLKKLIRSGRYQKLLKKWKL